MQLRQLWTGVNCFQLNIKNRTFFLKFEKNIKPFQFEIIILHWKILPIHPHHNKDLRPSGWFRLCVPIVNLLMSILKLKVYRKSPCYRYSLLPLQDRYELLQLQLQDSYSF